jgi:hypothetical protein
VRPYFVRGDPGAGVVEAWSGYPLQFDGQRRFAWQDAMADELRQALSGLPVAPEAVLAGMYLSTDHARCEVENRPFTNPGTSGFAKGLAAIRFERGVGPVGPAGPAGPAGPGRPHGGPPALLRLPPWRGAAIVGAFRPAGPWHRVTRHAADDGSCRPVWLAMKVADAAGQVEVLAPRLPAGTVFGVRAVIHATFRGPRQAAAVSETVLDGMIAAFHAGLGHGLPQQPWPRPSPRSFPAR